MDLNAIKFFYLNNLESIKIKKNIGIPAIEIYEDFRTKYNIENKYLFELAYNNCHDFDEAELYLNDYVETGSFHETYTKEADQVLETRSELVSEKLILSHVNVVVQFLTKYAKGRYNIYSWQIFFCVGDY
jgi:hypothetical protein